MAVDRSFAGAPSHRSTRRVVRWWRLGLRDWLDVARAVIQEVRADHVPLVSAGVAFYAVLGLIPASIMAITLYGMVTSAGEAEAQIVGLLDVLPADTASVVAGQLRPLATSPEVALSLGFAISAVGLLWTTSNATRAVVRAVVIAYNAEAEQSPLERRIASLALTVAALVMGIALLALVALLPAWLLATGDASPAASLRWILVLVLGGTASLLLYRYAPPRAAPTWGSLVPAALFTAVAWVVISLGFSFYVAHFGSYNETYGALGAAVVLMLWFFLCGAALMVGGELAAELERSYAAR